ncbi:MAG: hypothetical protein IT285_15795 [Bdellovibrionales bacterium]|nr:hypothetical protein [Bdellovibrionales bacterium]
MRGNASRGLGGSSRALGAAVAFAASLALFGCNNNFVDNPGVGNGLSTGSGSPVGTGGDSGSTGGTLAQLERVVLSSADPTGSLDLIGVTDTGQFGILCGGEVAEGGDAPCRCKYRFSAGSSPEEIEVLPSYVEADLIRCPRTEISPSATAVEVSINFLTQGLYSNEVIIPLNQDIATIDTTLPSSFLPVHRYQCREYLFIPYLYATSTDAMYDPFQSDSTRLSFPINFYTTNIGGTLMARYAVSTQSNNGNGQSDYECNLDFGKVARWENLPIWSKEGSGEPVIGCRDGTEAETVGDPCPDGSLAYDLVKGNDRTIYMPTTSPDFDHAEFNTRRIDRSNALDTAGGTYEWDRANFLVAREKVGLFSIPLNAYIAPNIRTTTLAFGESSDPTAGKFAPLGYAAQPIPDGEGGERCPSSEQIAIPNGYHWAKIFAWRASVHDRLYVRSSTAVQKSSKIMCDPGNFENALTSGALKAAINDCAASFPNVLGDEDHATSVYPTPPYLDTEELGYNRTGGGSNLHLQFEQEPHENLMAARVMFTVVSASRQGCFMPGNESGVGTPRENFEAGTDAPFNWSGNASTDATTGTDHWWRVGGNGGALSGEIPWSLKTDTSDYWGPVSGGAVSQDNLSQEPHDPKANIMEDSLDSSSSSFDYVIVVTPPFINRADFGTLPVVERAKHFIPSATKSWGDCDADNDNIFPDSPEGDADDNGSYATVDPDAAATECRSGRMKNYGLVPQEILDAAVVGPPVFPLCVLQKTPGT